MPWWGWVLVGLLSLVAVDRVVAHLGPQLPHRPRRPRPTGSGGGALGELIAGFQPSVRHLWEESERQRHDLVQPGDGDPLGRTLQDADVVSAGRARAPENPPARVHTCRLVRVAPGVWTHTATTWVSVTTIVVGDDAQVLLIDPNVTPGDLEVITGELDAHGWRVAAGFATHAHWDHLVWSAAFGDVPRWATPTAASGARSEHATLVRAADDVAPGHDPALIGQVRALPGTSVPWPGPEVVVLPYPGHCPGSAGLLVPHARVLVTGDVLSDTEIPLLGPGPDAVEDYQATLDVLEQAADRVDVLVPGHGVVCGRAGMLARIAADRAYLTALAGARAPDDPRLADPEQAEAHAAHLRQVHGT